MIRDINHQGTAGAVCNTMYYVYTIPCIWFRWLLISIVCRIELVDKRFSLWEAGEGQFDRDVPEDAKDQEDHDRGPQDYEYSSQELESKPYSMALNLHTIVIATHFWRAIAGVTSVSSIWYVWQYPSCRLHTEKMKRTKVQTLCELRMCSTANWWAGLLVCV